MLYIITKSTSLCAFCTEEWSENILEKKDFNDRVVDRILKILFLTNEVKKTSEGLSCKISRLGRTETVSAFSRNGPKAGPSLFFFLLIPHGIVAFC
jgi:hypothetical protein